MKQTGKATELEKQVSSLRSQHAALLAQVSAKGVRAEQLIALRVPLYNLVLSANNAALCSMLYSDQSFGRQLTGVKAQLLDLAALNEKTISSRFASRKPETAAASKLAVLGQSLPLPGAVQDGYTGFHDGERVVPVYFMRYQNVADVARFTHARYTIWFKSNKEFSTGFLGWPTARGWTKVGASRELLPAIQAALAEDGLV